MKYTDDEQTKKSHRNKSSYCDKWLQLQNSNILEHKYIFKMLIY